MRFYVAKRNHPISNLKSEQFDSCSTNPTQFNELNFSIPHSIFFSFIDRPSRAPIQITVDARTTVDDAYSVLYSTGIQYKVASPKKNSSISIWEIIRL